MPDIPVPGPPKVDQDTIFNRFTSLVLDHTRWVAVIVLVLVLMALWKRPLWRGVLIGALVITGAYIALH